MSQRDAIVVAGLPYSAAVSNSLPRLLASLFRPLAHNLAGGAVMCCAALAIGAPTSPAHADTQHTVANGQNLAAIARKYGVTPWSLAAANGLPPESPVRAGQTLTVPEPGIVYINPGQTLWSVARRHGCTVEALAHANGLHEGASLTPGQRLRLPGRAPSQRGNGARNGAGKELTREGGNTGVANSQKGGRSYGAPRQPGRAELFRVATEEHLVITLVDKRGRVRPQAPTQLARFLRPRLAPGKQKPPQKRLIALLARVSDHFGGRKMQVVSGYRVAGGFTKHSSRHVAGAAIDLRVDGIPNRTLVDYLRHFDDVGIGFYPNSTFVHFDVRDKNAFWIDLSGPGQKPQYLTREERDQYPQRARLDQLASVNALVNSALDELEHGEPEAKDTDDE